MFIDWLIDLFANIHQSIYIDWFSVDDIYNIEKLDHRKNCHIPYDLFKQNITIYIGPEFAKNYTL